MNDYPKSQQTAQQLNSAQTPANLFNHPSLTPAMNYFWPPTRPDAQWVLVGPLAHFPDVADDDGNLIQPRACDAQRLPGCRIMVVPKTDPAQASEILIPAGAVTSPTEGEDLTDQVVVFRYRDKVHAVDHVSAPVRPSSQMFACAMHVRHVHLLANQKSPIIAAMPAQLIPAVQWDAVRH